MASLWMEFGQGFAFNANGGLQIATGWDETRQYLERIAFTTCQTVNQQGIQIDPDWLYDVNYGLALRVKIGQLLPGQAIATLTQAIEAAASSAPGTDPASPPTITVNQNGHTFTVNVTVYLSNGLSGQLSYQVS